MESSLGRVPQALMERVNKFRKSDRVGRRGLFEPREDFLRLLTYAFPWIDSVDISAAIPAMHRYPHSTSHPARNFTANLLTLEPNDYEDRPSNRPEKSEAHAEHAEHLCCRRGHWIRRATLFGQCQLILQRKISKHARNNREKNLQRCPREQHHSALSLPLYQFRTADNQEERNQCGEDGIGDHPALHLLECSKRFCSRGAALVRGDKLRHEFADGSQGHRSNHATEASHCAKCAKDNRNDSQDFWPLRRVSTWLSGGLIFRWKCGHSIFWGFGLKDDTAR